MFQLAMTMLEFKIYVYAYVEEIKMVLTGGFLYIVAAVGRKVHCSNLQ